MPHRQKRRENKSKKQSCEHQGCEKEGGGGTPGTMYPIKRNHNGAGISLQSIERNTGPLEVLFPCLFFLFFLTSVPKHYRWHCHSSWSLVLQSWKQTQICWLLSSRFMSHFLSQFPNRCCISWIIIGKIPNMAKRLPYYPHAYSTLRENLEGKRNSFLYYLNYSN